MNSLLESPSNLIPDIIVESGIKHVVCFSVDEDKKDLSHMTAAQRIMHGLENQDSGIEDRSSQSEDEVWSDEEVEDTFKLNLGRPARPEECMSDDEVCI